MRPYLTVTILALALAAPGLAVSQPPAEAPAAAPMAKAPGEGRYEDNCAACHQLKGEGITGAFPGLANSPFVAGAPEVLTTTVLMGRGGMPAFRNDLDDAAMADVLTYLRTSWGNKAKPITAGDVAAVRAKVAPVPPPKDLQAH